MTPPHESSVTPLKGESRAVPEQECLELMATTTVGRVAFVNADGLQLMPLNFALIDGEIYFRTATDSVLDDLTEGDARVAFGVDYHSGEFREGWSVTVKGLAIRVSDPATYERVMSWSRLRPWAGGTRGVVIRLIRQEMDGRRVHGDRTPKTSSTATRM